MARGPDHPRGGGVTSGVGLSKVEERLTDKMAKV